MSGGPERSAGEIERDLRGTRIAIARTLDALEHKLRARHLVQEGLAMVSETLTEPGDAGAMRETGSQVVERAGAVSGYAGDRAGRLAGDWGRRSALPVGAVAVVAGALLAAALPFSRFEAD
jgi:hypothetical protein